MPRFFFDLILNHRSIPDPGGLVLEGPSRAILLAHEYAQHLFVCRSDLRDSGSLIRVRDRYGKEIHLQPVDIEVVDVDPSAASDDDDHPAEIDSKSVEVSLQ